MANIRLFNCSNLLHHKLMKVRINNNFNILLTLAPFQLYLHLVKWSDLPKMK